MKLCKTSFCSFTCKPWAFLNFLSSVRFFVLFQIFLWIEWLSSQKAEAISSPWLIKKICSGQSLVLIFASKWLQMYNDYCTNWQAWHSLRCSTLRKIPHRLNSFFFFFFKTILQRLMISSSILHVMPQERSLLWALSKWYHWRISFAPNMTLLNVTAFQI